MRCAAVLASFLISTLVTPAAASTCGPIQALIGAIAGRINVDPWDAFTLRRAQEAKHLVLLGASPPSAGTSAPWLVISVDGTDPTHGCILSKGVTIVTLQSIEDNKLTERFGLPGSGHPRCSRSTDFLGSVNVRGWANRELGSSLVFGLSDAISGFKGMTLLISRLSGEWILVSHDDATNVSCYFDRGDTFGISQHNFSAAALQKR